MTIFGLILILTYSLLLLTGCDDGEGVNSDGGLYCPRPAFYFGIPVSQNQIYAHIYEVENISDSLIVIDRVSTTCGCTSTGISQDSLFPGDMATVATFFKSLGYTHSTTQGLRLHHGDDILELSFQIDCGLEPTLLDPTPDTLILHRDSVLSEIVFHVRNLGGDQLTLYCLDWFSSFYECPSIEPVVLEPDGISEIRLSPMPDASEGDFQPCSITLEGIYHTGSERISIAITDNPAGGPPPDTTYYPDKY